MSTVKVNKIDKRTGSTLELGGPGTAVTLACGATQSGFGRTGTVDWCTTAKTSPFTSESGKGYFVNTTSGAVTVTLPASPSAGDIVAIVDYAGTSASNNITIGRNGSNINGSASCLTINKSDSGITLVYVDGTEGWKNTETSNISDINLSPEFIVATGGTITTSGNFKIHTFNSDSTFSVSAAGNETGSNTVDYLVVGGGGGGGGNVGGGGGAGGYRFSDGTASGCYSAGPSPLGATAIPVSVQGYPVTVGGGGAGGTTNTARGTSGTNSVFSAITSTGGGGGGTFSGAPGCSTGLTGGSGGGGGSFDCTAAAPNRGQAGAGNTPPVSPPQGNNGGAGGIEPGPPGAYPSGGGGGAGAVGGSGSACGASPRVSGAGGAGLASCISASPVTRGGGGGGASGNSGTNGAGGSGGGGVGGKFPSNPAAGSGTANTGGGGGGGDSGTSASDGGTGGSGVVIIRYKFQ